MIEGILTRQRDLPYIQIPLKFFNITLDISWLVVAPAVIWALATVYVPITSPDLSGLKAWIVAMIILTGIFVSLLVHVLAHTFSAHLLHCDIPTRVPVHLLGDTAQVWPAPRGAQEEALISGAGILAHGFLAAIAYFLWNAQLTQFLNVISFFLIFFNLGLMALNLTPAFPFDGGRLARSGLWRLNVMPGSATRLVYYLGFFFSVALMGWSGFLFSQQTRFSLETGAATLTIAFLIIYNLLLNRNSNFTGAEPIYQIGPWLKVFRWPASIFLFFLLTAVTFSLIPMNYGLEAPGFTAPVGQMVQLPQQYRYPSRGKFIISNVILQAPILAGEWVYGKLDTSVKLVPQEKIVPVTGTAQSVAQRSYYMLLDSKTIATVLGLRLAGYPVYIDGNNVRLPFPVEINQQKTFGGPSAGLMFTLGVYDAVSPEDFTGGKTIAGTGTINLDGRVGAVGGIPQKVVAAERAGAHYFLCPSWNYPEALKYAERMQVIKVDTIYDAVDFLVSIPPSSDN